MSRPVVHFLGQADVVLAVGTSLTKHGMATPMPSGKTFIHVTNDERDLHKNFSAQYPILGDAKLVLRQFIEAAQDLLGGKRRDGAVVTEIAQVREEWLKEWTPSWPRTRCHAIHTG